MKRLLAITAGLVIGAGAAHANLLLTDFNTAATQDFQSYAGAGVSPGATNNVGDLDSNYWRLEGGSDGDTAFGGTTSGGDAGRGTSSGGATTGGAYAFNVDGSGDFALGFQATGSDFAPGELTLRIQNDTGSTVTRLDVAYSIFEYNDQGRANSFNFAHSSDDSTYTAEASLNFTSTEAAAGSPAWVEAPRSISLTGLSIADGDSYYLQWQSDDVGGSGSRDELALNDVSVTAIPEPGTMVLAMFGFGMIAAMRRRLINR